MHYIYKLVLNFNTETLVQSKELDFIKSSSIKNFLLLGDGFWGERVLVVSWGTVCVHTCRGWKV